MNITRRRGAISFFVILGICLVGLAVLLNVGWIIVNVNTRRIAALVLGIIFFMVLIAGLILNTIFLVREIRRNERQDSFLNAVTHELKTPIASIRLYLETLQRRPLEEGQRQHFYSMMMADNERLLATVEQILRAGESGQRKRARSRLPVDLRALALECVHTTLQRHHLAEGAVRLDDQTGEIELYVEGDTDDLRTALLNVLDNAVKYSPEGVDITVELSAVRRGWGIVRVTDKGVGIPPAMLKRVFYRFYRVQSKSAAGIKGTGLGLFIVRSIARQHGGDATAQSYGMGHGSTITLQLPLMQGAVKKLEA